MQNYFLPWRSKPFFYKFIFLHFTFKTFFVVVFFRKSILCYLCVCIALCCALCLKIKRAAATAMRIVSQRTTAFRCSCVYMCVCVRRYLWLPAFVRFCWQLSFQFIFLHTHTHTYSSYSYSALITVALAIGNNHFSFATTVSTQAAASNTVKQTLSLIHCCCSQQIRQLCSVFCHFLCITMHALLTASL